MPKLMVIYDPKDKIHGLPEGVREHFGVKEAILSISEDLENIDRYAIARKLAELLMEQL